MEVKQVLSMVGGCGDTSYANNSNIQGRVIAKAKTFVEEAISKVCKNFSSQNMVAVDLGCSTGPNTLSIIAIIMNAIDDHYNALRSAKPEIQLFLNDLPSNDFNSIFQSLMLNEKKIREGKGENFPSIYVVGSPGSFYERLFPQNSVHLFHSSSALGWLSQVPHGLLSEEGVKLNKGIIYIPTNSSSHTVANLYSEQFKSDFLSFLKARSEELIFGGRMVLTILGNKHYPNEGEPYLFWEPLSQSLNEMVKEGLIKEESLDTFIAPFYAPSLWEVKSIIQIEGSFIVEKEQTFEISYDPFEESVDHHAKSCKISGEQFAKVGRPVLEPILVSHFGEDIIEDLFLRYTENIIKYITTENTKGVCFTFMLKYKDEYESVI